jgi:ABC-type branched-subunit amino acid transport system substrate-binding protein
MIQTISSLICFSSWRGPLTLIGAAFILAACQQYPAAPTMQGSLPQKTIQVDTPEVPQNTAESQAPDQNQQTGGSTSATIQNSAVQEAPGHLETAALPDQGTPPESQSKWQSMLEPYLRNKSTDTALAPSLMPPLLPLSDGTVRVGILLPLTGQNGSLGHAMLNAAQMAMFDFANTDFELLPFDTTGSPEQASFGANMIIGDGASLIIGPLLSSSVRAVTPVTQAAGVPVLAFSSDSNITGNNIYTMGFLPENNTERVISYAISQGYSRFAILAPNDAYGSAVVRSARQTIARYGRALVDTTYYASSGSNIEIVVRELADYDYRRSALVDMRKELRSQDDELSIKALKRLRLLETLGDLPYDALLIADGGKRLQKVAALLPFYDIDPGKIRILGTGQWDVNGIGAEPALVGAWFAAPPTNPRTSFITRYTELFGAHPPRLASMAYDAMALAAVLARGETKTPFTSSAFLFEQGYAGKDGIFRFTTNGTADRGLAVYQVHQRKNTIIHEAPKSFVTAVN